MKHLRLLLGYGTVALVSALLAAFILYHQWRRDLEPWHLASLDAEFKAEDVRVVKTLGDYQRVEERVFSQLQHEVYEQVPMAQRRRVNHYTHGSLADPTAYPRNWNRSFVLDAVPARGGLLLLHGLSDSPYSMRAIGERLNRKGWLALGLRLPGHGTAPVGLTRAIWQDFAAAVRLGARHLRQRIGPDSPLFIVGYSNGAALAVEFALARLGGEDLPRVDGLVLLSPAIGVSPAAALAVWQARLARIPGLEKLAWTALAPEYDPYKYASFAVNAGDQVYQLTRVLDGRLEALTQAGGDRRLPPIMAIQSVADATVSVRALLHSLLLRLAPGGHELLVFDINRNAEINTLMNMAAVPGLDALLGGAPLNFTLSLLRNAGPGSQQIEIVHRAAGESLIHRETTERAWPPLIYSLSHVALPFAPDDPIYGSEMPRPARAIYLGRPNLLGERGLLAIPAADLMRLRFNPFFDFMEARIEAFLLDHSPHAVSVQPLENAGI